MKKILDSIINKRWPKKAFITNDSQNQV